MNTIKRFISNIPYFNISLTPVKLEIPLAKESEILCKEPKVAPTVFPTREPAPVIRPTPPEIGPSKNP